MFPLKQRLVSGYKFGVPTFYNDFHLGVDYKAATGDPLYAPEDGEIIKEFVGHDGGNTIWFKGKTVHTFRFLHLKEFVKGLGPVKEGQLIAYCDNTGVSTNAHLHLDITKPGLAVDPNKPSNFIDPEKYQWYNTDMTCQEELIEAKKEIIKLNTEIGRTIVERDEWKQKAEYNYTEWQKCLDQPDCQDLQAKIDQIKALLG